MTQQIPVVDYVALAQSENPYKPYLISTKDGIKYAVTCRSNVREIKGGNLTGCASRGGGNTVHNTEKEALEYGEFNRKLDIQDEQRRLQGIEQEKIDLAAKLEREDLNGFDSGMTPLKRGKVIKTLNKQYSSNGKIVILRDIIRDCVKEGRLIETYQGERILINKTTETFKTETNLTKTGMDYAAHLINLRGMKEPSISEDALTNFMGEK